MWVVALSSKYLYATWAVETVEAMSRHTRYFPHERVEYNSISIKITGPEVSEGNHLGYICGTSQLLYRAATLFYILTWFGPPQDVMKHLHINFIEEWWNSRCKICTADREARVRDVVNLVTSFRSLDIIGPEHKRPYLELRLPLPKCTLLHIPYPSLGERDSKHS